MALLTDSDLRALRDEVGNSPDDDTLQDLWDAIGPSVPAVALAILRPRLADAIKNAAAGGATIPGIVAVVAPSQPTLLAAQIARLEAQLAAENGTPDASGLAASSVLVGRTDRAR